MTSRPLLVLVAALSIGCSAEPRGPEPVGRAASPLVIEGLFPTGLDGFGAPLADGATDPHYTLSSDDPSLPGPSAVTVSTLPGGWLPNLQTSRWISARADAQATAGAVYTFTTTFTLPALNPNQSFIQGQWTSDAGSLIKLNGNPILVKEPGGADIEANFEIPDGSGFVAGVNTLSFEVTAGPAAIVGLRVLFVQGTIPGCEADVQCAPQQWCDSPGEGIEGTCHDKLENGEQLPSQLYCNPNLAKRACKSGACDYLDGACGLLNSSGACLTDGQCRSGACDKDDQVCGYPPGEGPCTSTAECRSTSCDTATQLCEAITCLADEQCPYPQFCKDHICAPRVADGAACTRAEECQSFLCDGLKCIQPDGLVGAGAVSCAVPRGAGDGALALAALALAAAALGRRRRPTA